MQSNTSPLTIQILLSDPIPTADSTSRLDVPQELQSLNPLTFFPICSGSCYTDYLAHHEYALIINSSGLLVNTDFANYPNYGAVWLISEDRRTFTYSHTEEDL